MKIAVAISLCICLAGCSSNGRVVLGNQSPPTFVFGAPVVVAELVSTAGSSNPTLTADMLEIFFSRNDGADTRIWFATRPSRAMPFGVPAVVAELTLPSADDMSPAISADGLTLWFGSNRPGGIGDLDIWASTRPSRSSPWLSPTILAALNSPSKDIPRPLGQHGSVMPMSSERETPGLYQMYLATRSSGSTFAAPTPVAEINSTSLNHVDGFLTDDGMALFFTQGPLGGPADLWVTWRKSTSEPFGSPVALDGINTAAYDELDSWLSPDGTQFYFTSNRSGTSQIYTASVSRIDSGAAPAGIDAAVAVAPVDTGSGS